jgi:hypothetical protein
LDLSYRVALLSSSSPFLKSGNLSGLSGGLFVQAGWF